MLGTSVSNAEPAGGALGPRIALSVLLAAGLVAAPLHLEAQNADPGPRAGTLSFDARGGVAVPLDALLDEIGETGASFGGGVAYHVTPGFALRGDVEYEALSGGVDDAGIAYADMTALYAVGGPEVHFSSPETRWTGSLSLGAGISSLETEDTLDSGGAPPVSADLTSLTFRAGAKLGYAVTDAVDLYLEPAVYLLTFDRADTRAFDTASPAVGPKDVGWILPIQAGVRFNIQ